MQQGPATTRSLPSGALPQSSCCTVPRVARTSEATCSMGGSSSCRHAAGTSACTPRMRRLSVGSCEADSRKSAPPGPSAAEVAGTPALLGAARRARAAAARPSSSACVSDQSMHGVVTDMPSTAGPLEAAGPLVRAEVSGCTPETRKLLSTTPETAADPEATSSPMRLAAADWSSSAEQSTTVLAGSPAAVSTSQTSPTRASPATMAWQSLLPVVCTTPATPCFETPMNGCACAASLMARTAISLAPAAASKPTGMERPEESSA
mmetsp:Transcript_26334/g.65099  ORF Transcript_26334/g.65099 Transcript_26334/m.65099 type:complete len:264 (-) Transcript_26334:1626-2417(-)